MAILNNKNLIGSFVKHYSSESKGGIVLIQIMVMYPPQPADPVTAGFNEETGDPVEITVSWIFPWKYNDEDELICTIYKTVQKPTTSCAIVIFFAQLDEKKQEADI